MNDLLTARIIGADAHVHPDDRDDAILAERVTALDARPGVRVGDFVDFPDGTRRRVSYIWTDDNIDGFWATRPAVQTSDHGSYHLGDGYVSMSGSLFTGVAPVTLHDTGELRLGQVWFFHHDWWRAHNAVRAVVPFRVFACSVPAPTS